MPRQRNSPDLRGLKGRARDEAREAWALEQLRRGNLTSTVPELYAGLRYLKDDPGAVKVLKAELKRRGYEVPEEDGTDG